MRALKQALNQEPVSQKSWLKQSIDNNAKLIRKSKKRF